MATGTRRDVERTKGIDRIWSDYQGVLLARMAAVISAQRALVTGELGAEPALRQLGRPGRDQRASGGRTAAARRPFV